MTNIVRFNWPMYVQGLLAGPLLLWASPWLGAPWSWLALVGGWGALYLTVGSLLVSYYVYDLSPLYRFDWLPSAGDRVANIHSGFDESSLILRERYPHAQFSILDFYDPELHTEPSIARARAFRPPLPETVRCTAASLPLADASCDLIFVILAAHEIRDRAERVRFLQEVARSLRGQAVVVEHVRDVANFLAYGPGFLHFHSACEWRNNFRAAGLQLESERRITPFVRVFFLRGG